MSCMSIKQIFSTALFEFYSTATWTCLIPSDPTGIDLPQHTKAKTAALQNALQGYINELTAQREKAVALIQQIPDQTARTVIELRYGLIGSGYEWMPYLEIGETLNYADKTILSYRKRGVDQLNRLLEDSA